MFKKILTFVFVLLLAVSGFTVCAEESSSESYFGDLQITDELPEFNGSDYQTDEDVSFSTDDKEQDEYNVDNFNEGNLLASLVVNNARLSPNFDPKIKTYDITVTEKVKELEIEAKAQENDAKVEITGTKLYYSGANARNITKITVTSKNGIKRTYIINTVRIVLDDVENNNNEFDKFSFIWFGSIVAIMTFVIGTLVFIRRKK